VQETKLVYYSVW